MVVSLVSGRPTAFNKKAKGNALVVNPQRIQSPKRAALNGQSGSIGHSRSPLQGFPLGVTIGTKALPFAFIGEAFGLVPRQS